MIYCNRHHYGRMLHLPTREIVDRRAEGEEGERIEARKPDSQRSSQSRRGTRRLLVPD